MMRMYTVPRVQGIQHGMMHEKTRLTGGTYRSRSASRDGQGTGILVLGSGTSSKRVLNWVWVSRVRAVH